MDEREQIKELEREIEMVADIEAKLHRYARREPSGGHRQLVEDQLRDVSKRLDRAQAEVRELVAQRQLTIARERRRRMVYAEIGVRPPLRIFEFEEVAA